jgi:hypothetical protein
MSMYSNNKKITIVLLTMMITSCSGGFGTMKRIMTSWEGAHLDQVISQWGYPHAEQTIAGRKVYIWDRNVTVTMPSTTSGTGSVIGNTVNISSTTFGGGTSTWGCRRILEVNDSNYVVAWQWSGNNCPFMDIGMGYQYWERKKPSD